MSSTKYVMAEQVLLRLKGGNPTAASTVNLFDIKKAIEQHINKALQAQQFTVNLPSGETIPDGLSILTYDSVPVTTYKNILSRAKLPALPIMLPRGMGVFHISPAITDNTTSLSIVSVDADKPESISGLTEYTFNVARTGDSTGYTTLFYVVAGYGALQAQPIDFGGAYPYGQIQFNPGDTVKTITVPVVGAGTIFQLQFSVTISNPTPSTTTISNAQAVGTIIDSLVGRITMDGNLRITQDSNTRILQ